MILFYNSLVMFTYFVEYLYLTKLSHYYYNSTEMYDNGRTSMITFTVPFTLRDYRHLPQNSQPSYEYNSTYVWPMSEFPQLVSVAMHWSFSWVLPRAGSS